MTTRVEETTQCAVGALDDENAFVADTVGASVSWLLECVSASEAHPSPGEQVFVFPCQNRGIGVRRGRKHPAAVAHALAQICWPQRQAGCHRRSLVFRRTLMRSRSDS